MVARVKRRCQPQQIGFPFGALSITVGKIGVEYQIAHSDGGDVAISGQCGAVFVKQVRAIAPFIGVPVDKQHIHQTCPLSKFPQESSHRGAQKKRAAPQGRPFVFRR